MAKAANPWILILLWKFKISLNWKNPDMCVTIVVSIRLNFVVSTVAEIFIYDIYDNYTVLFLMHFRYGSQLRDFLLSEYGSLLMSHSR